MKVAIVHELLTIRGGAEKVAKIFADMFPDAPIYTLLYDEKKLGDWFPRSRVRMSNINPWMGTNHHLYLDKFASAVEVWDFSEFDLVISSSSAFTHGILTNGKPKHLCYVHSPARYLWDRTHDVQKHMNPINRFFFKRLAHRLRIWDSEAADRPEKLLAASEEVKRRIELYWRRDSTVVYPPLDDFWFQRAEATNERKYFLVASTLARYKRIDLAILAANALKLPLKVAGEGAEFRRLKKLAGPTVEMLGFQTKEELKKLYTNAIATIIPGEEDFGLVPLESLACGTPVIAYKKGGILETIEEGKTGAFFTEPNAESLAQAINNFDHKKYSMELLQAAANRFSRKEFEKKIQTEIDSLMYATTL